MTHTELKELLESGAYISDTVHETQSAALEEATQWLQGVLN